MKRSFVGGGGLLARSPRRLRQWPLHRSACRKAPTANPIWPRQPHAADGKPDFSGIWMISGGAGTGIPAGLPFQPWAAGPAEEARREGGLNDPDGACLPQGLLQYVDPQPLKIVQTPTQILIIYESNYGLRTIYMDGRTLPPLGQRSRGNVVLGRWEGDTLVVESNNFRGVDPRRSVASSRAASTESDGSITEAAHRSDEGHRAIPACELRTARHRVHG